LHPNVDSRGVHRFEPTEVEDLAHEVDAGRVMLGQQLRPLGGSLPMDALESRDECASCAVLEGELSVLRSRLEAQAGQHRRELASLRAQHEADRAKQDAALTDLLEQVAEVVELLDA